MDVLITVDTEFSSAGYFNNPDHNSPVLLQAVFCSFNGRSYGLGFLLDTFTEYGIRATFFVETAHTLMLGTDVMKPAVDAILTAGHDVQLHVHPMWLAAEGSRKPVSPATDSMSALDEGTCERLIEVGLAAFRTWSAPTPQAFRAGNLDMGRTAYRALKRSGILISSSIGVALRVPEDPDLWIENGRKRIDGVTEVPVSAFADLSFGQRRHLRNLTIAGSGSTEILAVLEDARLRNVAEAVLLAHPFDFVKKSDARYTTLTPNKVNRHRLQALCQRIASAPEHFQAATFAERASKWIEEEEAGPVLLKTRSSSGLARMVTNKMNDLLWWF